VADWTHRLVRFSHPVVGEGWLSASGKFYAKDAYTLQVVFDNFWVDGVNRYDTRTENWREGSKVQPLSNESVVAVASAASAAVA